MPREVPQLPGLCAQPVPAMGSRLHASARSAGPCDGCRGVRSGGIETRKRERGAASACDAAEKRAGKGTSQSVSAAGHRASVGQPGQSVSKV